jgi:pyruvate dehydrogenase E1 component beta subunit
MRVAAPDAPVPLARLVESYMPDIARIRRALDEVLRY